MCTGRMKCEENFDELFMLRVREMRRLVLSFPETTKTK